MPTPEGKSCTHKTYATSISAKKALAVLAAPGTRRKKVGKVEKCDSCGKWKVVV